MRRLACVTLFALVAAGPSTADALHPLVYKDHPLVYKALLPMQSVPKPNPIQSPILQKKMICFGNSLSGSERSLVDCYVSLLGPAA